MPTDIRFDSASRTVYALNAWTLSFPGDIESDFRNYYAKKYLNHTRRCTLLAIFFYAIFGILDLYQAPEAIYYLWSIRFLFFLPLASIFLLCTYHDAFLPFLQVAITGVTVCAGGGIIAMLFVVSPTVRDTYYAGLILVFMFCYTLLRLRFHWASLAGWLIVIGYELTAAHYRKTPPAILLNNNFFFISANIIGMLVSYCNEFYIRRDYASVRLLNLERQNAKEQAEKLRQAKLYLEEEMHAHTMSRRQLMETEIYLFHAEKMIALGQLAAGLSHEINNNMNFISASLTPLVRNIHRLQDEMLGLSAESTLPLAGREETFATLFKLVDFIKIGTIRTANIVKELRDFACPGEEDPVRTDVHKEIDQVLAFLLPARQGAITVCKEYDRSLPPVFCHRTQLDQIFTNIFLNAFEAMKNKGSLSIRTGQNQGRITIAIRDSGPGIPREFLDKIFNPFFTTKPVNEGTGLGLSISDALIRKHHGEIRAQNHPAGGAIFEISFPIQPCAAG